MRWMGHVAMGNSKKKKETFLKNPEENKTTEIAV